ncbi:unnamed protein product [Cuscuta europaea]|uniref:Uncharacterized protein n=1 Tax=Cuscuta europaea TaxID=41803 RepID=A0A9P1E5I8_CUSEU|nr:unnamed protein product [Cuscuta europaea]
MSKDPKGQFIKDAACYPCTHMEPIPTPYLSFLDAQSVSPFANFHGNIPPQPAPFWLFLLLTAEKYKIKIKSYGTREDQRLKGAWIQEQLPIANTKLLSIKNPLRITPSVPQNSFRFPFWSVLKYSFDFPFCKVLCGYPSFIFFLLNHNHTFPLCSHFLKLRSKS